MPYTLAEAARAIGRNKTTVLRAIKAGKISGVRDEASGGWLVEPAELHRVFPAASNAAGAALHAADGAAMRSGDAAGDSAERSDDAAAVVRELRAQLADKDETIADLRRRLDRADEERRTAQTQVMALLADRRAPQRRRRRFWPFGRRE